MVAAATAIRARFSPNFCTITSAIFSAAPVLIRVPARIPEVIILSTEEIILCAPLTIVSTVNIRFPLPITPPIRAPKIRL